jgi:hypothetical protein
MLLDDFGIDLDFEYNSCMNDDLDIKDDEEDKDIKKDDESE